MEICVDRDTLAWLMLGIMAVCYLIGWMDGKS